MGGKIALILVLSALLLVIAGVLGIFYWKRWKAKAPASGVSFENPTYLKDGVTLQVMCAIPSKWLFLCHTSHEVVHNMCTLYLQKYVKCTDIARYAVQISFDWSIYTYKYDLVPFAISSVFYLCYSLWILCALPINSAPLAHINVHSIRH